MLSSWQISGSSSGRCDGRCRLWGRHVDSLRTHRSTGRHRYGMGCCLLTIHLWSDSTGRGIKWQGLGEQSNSNNSLSLTPLSFTCGRGLVGGRETGQLQPQRLMDVAVTNTRQLPPLLRQLDADSTVLVEATSANACCFFQSSLWEEKENY